MRQTRKMSSEDANRGAHHTHVLVEHGAGVFVFFTAVLTNPTTKRRERRVGSDRGERGKMALTEFKAPHPIFLFLSNPKSLISTPLHVYLVSHSGLHCILSNKTG